MTKPQILTRCKCFLQDGRRGEWVRGGGGVLWADPLAGRTALHIAARKGHVVMVRALVERGYFCTSNASNASTGALVKLARENFFFWY
jgi:hypothetical protein